jgi:phosphoribosylanthranilate isomerase
MPRTRTKICGICRPEDAVAAAQAGADAIGIVFDTTSPRCVSIEQAAEIVAALPPFVMPVALFVNTPADKIRHILSTIPFGSVQLQGDEPPEFVAELKPLRVVKALHLKKGDAAVLEKWRSSINKLGLTNLIGLLLDTATGGSARGGTGIANDFDALHAMQHAGNFAGLPPIIFAGGLTPDNVGGVVKLLHPYAVDVSSGVEISKRQKSSEKIDAFIRAVRDVDAQIFPSPHVPMGRGPG